ncbi:4-phosphoerythronate dehydrogenase PdxB [Mangrovibacterium diazotrophicum]|uniref:Erythronate-4-phosphate dehydrogenase n=1 Tax=Mangrovibacterium diazotrophicum TaxID=1261403 RepID=A0A419VZ53_9BACT|nr:4-phosphoerythronate dehydrogenase PdxB [Mangrovibacterium diazotrophicum]RKD88512.1 erythronate-4-phosphate dehydrogenase [Mangrovibacterium diazotrophicum]
MKFVVDDKIPYIKGALEAFGEVVYLPGAKTTADVVRDADAIVTRTRTKCNEDLLKGSSVKFIATATIGFDHIDTNYCAEAGIEWTNAPGCNSKSVEQYVASTLFVLAEKHGFELKGKTIGVVGVGQVGSKVARFCEIIGMKVLLNDPPRERAEGSEKFVSLKEIQEQADFITIHVPLNMEGEDATFHLADENFFNNLPKKPFVFNSCRGEVVDSNAAKVAIKENKINGLVLDCWENEPDIDLELLVACDIATPHIAGYSKDGKANGTSMSIQAISRFFGLGADDWICPNIELPEQTNIQLDGFMCTEEQILAKAILSTYDIRHDDAALRANTKDFEKLRGDYPVRREFPVFTIEAANIPQVTLNKLEQIGFQIKTK